MAGCEVIGRETDPFPLVEGAAPKVADPPKDLVGRLAFGTMNLTGDLRALAADVPRLFEKTGLSAPSSGVESRCFGVFGDACTLVKGIHYTLQGIRGGSESPKEDIAGKGMAATNLQIGISSFVRALLALPQRVIHILSLCLVLCPALLDTMELFGKFVAILSIVTWSGYFLRSLFRLIEACYVKAQLKKFRSELGEEASGDQIIRGLEEMFRKDKQFAVSFERTLKWKLEKIKGAVEGVQKIKTALGAEASSEQTFLKIQQKCASDPNFASSLTRLAKMKLEDVRLEQAGEILDMEKRVLNVLLGDLQDRIRVESKEFSLFIAALSLSVCAIIFTSGLGSVLMIGASILLNLLFLVLDDIKDYMDAVKEERGGRSDRKILAVLSLILLAGLAAGSALALSFATGGLLPFALFIGSGAICLGLQLYALFHRKNAGSLPHREHRIHIDGDLEIPDFDCGS